jgi:hypothetical protein
MDPNRRATSWQRVYWQYLHELLFALNIAFLATSIAFSSPGLARPFFGLEVSINHILHIRQTDFIRGYFGFGIAAVLCACAIWLLLTAFQNTATEKFVLKYVAGLAALIAPPLFFLFLNHRTVGWQLGWESAEISLMLAAAWLYIRRVLKGTLVMITILAIHNLFWFWQFGPHFSTFNYTGPLAPATCFCSAVAWLYYLKAPETDHVSSLHVAGQPG